MNKTAEIRTIRTRSFHPVHVRMPPWQRDATDPAPRDGAPKAVHRHRLPAPNRGDGGADMTRQLLPELDGMLKLSRLLAENGGDRLSPRQVDYAQTLYSSATELRLAVERLIGQPGRGRRQADRPAPPSVRLAGRKLLLVASDVRALYTLTGVLERQGMRVVHATSEDELNAVLAREADLDAVVLDGEDAHLDAGQLLHCLRSAEAGARQPLIALVPGCASTVAEPEHIERLLSQLRRHLASAE